MRYLIQNTYADTQSNGIVNDTTAQSSANYEMGRRISITANDQLKGPKKKFLDNSMYHQVVQSQSSSHSIPGVDDKDMRAIFRAFDFDKDGQVSAKDLRIFLEAMGEQPSDAEINEMIRMADLGQDGAVHLSEFCDLFRFKPSGDADNEVYDETCKIMASLRLDLKKGASTYSSDEVLKRFISRLPGSVTGRSFLKKDALKDIISRWKSLKIDQVREKEFYELLRIKKNDTAERAFAVIAKNGESIDIRSFILILGVFVAASCEERTDFACRILDDSSSGLLVEDQIEKLLVANCVGIKSDIRARIEKVMKSSDANSMVSRKQLIQISSTDPGLLFPASRIDFPYN